MKEYLTLIGHSTLFSGVSAGEVEAMLNCLEASIAVYSKQALILRVGEPAQAIGLLLSGRACIQQEDFWGNRNIINKVLPGQLFAETYACTPGALLGVSVEAEEDCKVLFLRVGKVLSTCSSACTFHSRVIRNLLSEMAGKNLLLSGKLAHMAQRTTREKLLSYLSTESVRQGSSTFTIPFSRQQLADYLAVDRSAMSSALARLREEGVLDFKRSTFVLHETNS